MVTVCHKVCKSFKRSPFVPSRLLFPFALSQQLQQTGILKAFFSAKSQLKSKNMLVAVRAAEKSISGQCQCYILELHKIQLCIVEFMRNIERWT